jgi:hypothetical protein
MTRISPVASWPGKLQALKLNDNLTNNCAKAQKCAEKPNPAGTTAFPCLFAPRRTCRGQCSHARSDALVGGLDRNFETVHCCLRRVGLEFAYWKTFFDEAKARDLLDLVTVAYRYLAKGLTNQCNARKWLEGVQRIFREENIHYLVDRQGGVHFYLDHEFARATAAAISALQPKRYANSLDAFDKGLAALNNAPPDGKGGIRGVFSAIEGLFAVMGPGAGIWAGVVA